MAEIRPEKSKTHCTQLTIGGNLIKSTGDIKTPTSNLTIEKLISNSFFLTKNSKFMCTDIANLYLNNPMDRYEYMKLSLKITPNEIIPAEII